MPMAGFVKKLFKTLSPARLIALGFAGVILIGSGLLMLPCSLRLGVELSYIDALYTATSAVCVTGLVPVDVGTAFTPIGQFFLILLIQVGGLGVASVGAGIILAMGKKLDIKGRSLIREASNLDHGRGTIRFVKSVLLITLIFELTGAVLSFIVFIQDYPFWEALGHSLFHSISAFNNSGFDNLGLSGNLHSGVSLAGNGYANNVLLNLVTCGLIFFGGIGFLVIREVVEKRFRWKRLSMHSKVVISMSVALIVIGTLMLMITEHDKIGWLTAFFNSVSARTAGFATYNLGDFSDAGLMVMTVLMFIGASPGSTGGGIKTSTFFVLLQGIKSAATNRSERAFKYSVPKDAFKKAAIILLIGLVIIIVGTYLLVAFEAKNEDVTFMDALFEIVSAFGTVGVTTGITPGLSIPSKLLSILIMYIGRLGPLTIATLWYFTKGDRAEYPDGNIAIG